MGKGDIESGFSSSNGLYPSMMESPELRWGFIRKVYMLVSVQLLITSLVSSLFIFYQPWHDFARRGNNRLFVLIGCLVFTLILLFPLYKWHKKHPVNLILLGLYTLGMAFTVGIVCAFVEGTIIMMAAALTGVVVLSLTVYTFWAVKRGADFSFLGPFLFAASMLLLAFALIQFVLPFGHMGRMVFSGIGALLMCGFIIYDTANLIENYSYDDYIWAAIAIYGDIINLFLYLLTFLDELL
ncbi:hypothetical protein L6164_026849 [Bauhinia variegata]|uniref:Uncharacterized protein n=1 Tax=Bauhinia variegata TaxID=167791 RepID=A0ACB9LRF0_BAUVA|nr:hypothetical protein L6164_026849 [Bauhinia variegata]